MPQIVDIAVPVRVFKSFHYLVPTEMESDVVVGAVMEVPFRNRQLPGVVIGLDSNTQVTLSRLKVAGRLVSSEPLIDASMMKTLNWVAEYYCHPIGEVMGAAVPSQYWKFNEAQKAKLERLMEDPKFLSKIVPDTPQTMPLPLTEEQAAARDLVLGAPEGKTTLLHGVTGSGKTEVYLSVLAKTIEAGQGAIILVPEIALTPQLLARFSGRFPHSVAVIHSGLTPREKYVQWERIRRGLAKIVIGPRSAVFAPVQDLGLIVVDEEHETSYKQEDSLRYHARDVAILRALHCGAKVILGSATPSLESYWNVKEGKFQLAKLSQRVTKRSLPNLELVDLRERENWWSDAVPWLTVQLIQATHEALARGDQALFFLNRLGFANLLFCSDCGHSWRCHNCDVSLTYYRTPPSMKCHYCGSVRKPPTLCDSCGGLHVEAYGLGTEQLEAYLTEIFPEARIVRMDRAVIRNRKDLEEVLQKINSGDAQILIGTQMIAKGHDFPGVALVGILNADASMNFPDFRANERTYQMLTQVSGRAGRGESPGRVMIQTMNPEHPLLVEIVGGGSGFFRDELGIRKSFGYPPFQRLALVRFQHQNQYRVEQFADAMSRWIRYHSEKHQCSVVGPSEAPIAKIKKQFRWQLLVKSPSHRQMRVLLDALQVYAFSQKSPVQMSVDVDPLHVL